MTKRPDTSKRLKEKASKDEYVIKTGLNSHLKEKQLLIPLNELVINTSKIANRGSLIFNRLLLYCFQNNIPFPDLEDRILFVHCFNVGITKFLTEDKLVEQIYNTYFSNFLKLEKIKSDYHVIHYAACKYMINFHNYLINTFEQKQRKWIKEFGKRNNLNNEEMTLIRYRINNWKTTKDTELNDICNDFISNQKSILNINKEEINKSWLKKNIHNLCKYNYKCLNQFEEWNLKLFTLAPVSSIGKHFISIDNGILYYLAKNSGIINDNILQTFMDNKDERWSQIFNINKSKGKFSNFVDTDGTSICFHYLKDKVVDKDVSNKILKKTDNVIAIDPGRTNLIYGIENKTNKIHKLTRKQYYHEIKSNQRNKKARKWNKEISHELTIMSKVSIKTVKSENWQKFLTKYIKKYDILWEHYTQNKWSRLKFDSYINKNKCLDTFFASFNTNKEKPIIAYGAAKFNPNNKNELSAPTTFLSKKCNKFYTTIMIDEYNTTKMCCGCGNELTKIRKDVNGKFLEIRGLRWCSTKCRKFVNRDKNAAVNILNCFLTGNNRPNYLARNPRQSGKASQSQALSKVADKFLILV